ncbi:phosphatases II [Microstroma glucosiphilum]|uniref:protein-tyrosine-phosphatase n=1 Tax=Pseudomicrostroma glucosiphilum TaxID=1684307 RepID=A0A316UG03_9BASI|nr:phosphatases II [Pseudomicrostroma glucosiphilum]PWN23868.1 phosphatases II [Pseudomicrostroma glucosiphilum]
MLAHSPRAVDLARYGPSSSQSATGSSSSAPQNWQQQQQQQLVTCPDDSDFLDSDADGEACEVEEDLGLASTQGSQAGTASEPALAPEQGLIYVSHRLYFTYFADTLPNPDYLNQGDGCASALFEPPSRQLRPGESAPEYPDKYHWFNIDEDLVYLSFFEDWGPLNVGLFYRFCMHTHQLLNDPSLADRAFVFYTSSNPCRKANGSLLAAMYSMIIDHIEPADAFHPFSQLEFRPFRDAGYGRADYYLTIQDILYGVHRAIEEKLLDLSTFSLEEYEHYEQVQNGDWNWITPSFLAFASPNDREYVAEIKANGGLLPAAGSRMGRKLPKVITNTVRYFKERNVQLVVRLNNPLYDKDIFEEAGIQHVDMYFDDGSNPSEEILRDFIRRAHKVIQRGGSIAVHCKAGLGRTGVLIGAYLIWRYGFSASEVIGFMRIMRPGCVVGPQQHFMYQNFAQWIRWSVKDHAVAQAKKIIEAERAQMAAKGVPVESAVRRLKRHSEEGLDDSRHGADRLVSPDPVTPQARKLPRVIPATAAPAVKPVPCVGQPRKSPSPSRKRPANVVQAPSSRLCSATLQPSSSVNELPRSHSEESLSSLKHAEKDKSTPGSPGGLGVTSLRDSWEKIAGTVSPPRSPKTAATEDQARTPTSTTTASRVLAEAQRLNNATPERRTPGEKEDASQDVVGSVKIIASPARSVTVVRPAHERSRSEASPSAREEIDSPLGTPRANRVPSFAASPQVKAAYNLKPTPRSSPQPQNAGGQWSTNAADHGTTSSKAVLPSSSQQSDAEVLGVLGINPSEDKTTTTRPSLRTFGRTPSSNNSISPAKIRAPVMSAGRSMGVSSTTAGTAMPSTSVRPSASRTTSASRSTSGSNAAASRPTTTNGTSSSRVRPTTTATTRTAPSSTTRGEAPSDRLTNTLRKTSRSGANANANGNSSSSSASGSGNGGLSNGPANSLKSTSTVPVSNSGNAAMLAARANLKRARPSPDVVQGEFAPAVAAVGVGRGGASLTKTGGAGAGVGGRMGVEATTGRGGVSSSSSRPPTSSTATSTAARMGRNVRRRRSSLGAADIGMA